MSYFARLQQAAAGDSWLDGVPLSAVDKNILDKCADDDLPTDSYDFCDFCKW